RADVGKRLTTAGEQLRDMSEPPLGAFTQLALKPAPLFVRRLDDPAPRRLHLLDARTYLSLKPSVRHREPGRRADRCQQPGIIEEGQVMDETRAPLAVFLDRRDGPPRARRGKRDRPARLVRITTLPGQPVANHQRWITERPGQPVTQHAARSR